MTVQAPGYLRPRQTAPLTAAQEDTIAAICPGLGQAVTVGDRRDSVLWGPHVALRSGHATDPDTRFASSSGGALSAILAHLVENGTVDAVIQTTADPGIPVGNATTISVDPAEIRDAAGSRYAPSSPLADLDARLAEYHETGRRFAFVGKPCDVVALRAWMRRDPEVAAAFPMLLSFFCAGVPSRAGAEAVLAALGTDLADTRSFRFRGMGWPGRATAVTRDGAELSMSYHESWGRILSRHVQHRCKICADGTGVDADIVCADAWESDAEGYPLFEEADGTSLIVSRTQKGEALVRAAETAGAISTGPFDIDDLAAIQPGQRERRRALLARLTARRLAGRPIPRYRGLQIFAAARQNPVGRNLRNFLGMLRRSIASSRGAFRRPTVPGKTR